jgi:CysZ protein
MTKARFSMKKFTQGLRSLPEAPRFLGANRRLLKYAILPAIINAFVFIVFVWAIWTFGAEAFDRLVKALGPDPAGASGFLAFLLGAARVILIGALVLVGWTLLLILYGIVSGIVAGPFSAALGRQVYRIASGGLDIPGSETNEFLQLCRDLVFELKYLGYTIVVSLGMLLPLNLIPGVGSLLYLLRSQYFTATLLGWPHLARALARMGMPFADQRRFILAYRPACAGLGAGVMATLLIPLINLVQLPFAVTAGMLLYRQLETAAPVEHQAFFPNRPA